MRQISSMSIRYSLYPHSLCLSLPFSTSFFLSLPSLSSTTYTLRYIFSIRSYFRCKDTTIFLLAQAASVFVCNISTNCLPYFANNHSAFFIQHCALCIMHYALIQGVFAAGLPSPHNVFPYHNPSFSQKSTYRSLCILNYALCIMHCLSTVSDGLYTVHIR